MHYIFSNQPYPFGGISENWRDMFRSHNIAYVVGGAGYGKSLFLSNLIMNHEKLNILDSEKFLPIFCDLKNFLTETKKNKSMINFFQETMVSSTMLSKEDVSVNFINYHLNSGRCIILMDALDEVPSESRYELHKTIISYLKNINPNNRICITSRIRGFVPMEEVDVFDIPPLDKNQVEQYIDNIIVLDKFKASDKEEFLEQAKGLIEKRFLNSFLVLSLLVNIYKSERELPENKLDLYAKCFEYISNRREKDKDKPIKNYNWDKITPLMKDSTFINLAILCAPNNQEVKRENIINSLKVEYRSTFLDDASCENSVVEFLNFCSDRTELFVPAQEQEESFKFFHRSFFEYFYSMHIFLEIQEPHLIYEQFVKFDVDSEVFELTVAAFKQRRQAKYTELVDFVFDKAKDELQSSCFVAFNILTLMMQVSTEPIYQIKYVNILTEHSRVIAESLKDRESGIKNTDIIVTLFGSNDNFVSEMICSYMEFIDYELTAILSMLAHMDFDAFIKNEGELGKTIKFDVASESLSISKYLLFDDLRRVRPIGFYTILFLRSANLALKLDEYINNFIKPLKKISITYGLTKAQARQCRAILSSYRELDDPGKEVFCKSFRNLIYTKNRW